MPPGSEAARDAAAATARSGRDGGHPPDAIGADRSLLILDDDEPFLHRLTRAMEKRGFEVTAVDSVGAGRARVVEAGRRPTR